MPHRGVKIDHLARESVSEGEEKNQKEGKIDVECLRDFFFCKPEIRNFTL